MSDRALPNTRVQRTRSSPSARRSPLTRHPLGGPGGALWWLVAALAVAAPAAIGEREDGAGAKHGQIIQVMIQPEGKISVRDPIVVSLRKGNQVRWIGKNGAFVIFPPEGFPVLPDGTRLSIPPFVNMLYAETPDPRWFTECSEDICKSGAINPKLEEVFDRAKGGRLDYGYRISRGGQVVDVHLIVER